MSTKERIPERDEKAAPAVPDDVTQSPDDEVTQISPIVRSDGKYTTDERFETTDPSAGKSGVSPFGATLFEESGSARTTRQTKSAESSDSSDSKQNRFQLVDNFARGGLGNIWLAVDGRIRREVAFKELLPKALKSPTAVSRFLEEAQITGQLEHPGIVPIYELGFQQNGTPYYTMKLVRGETFDAAIKAYHELPANSAERNRVFIRLLRNFIDICNTLAFAHDHNVIHRDLKPQNVMLGQFGETLVLDWGLAKVIKSEDQNTTAELSTTAETGSAVTDQQSGQPSENQNSSNQTSTTSTSPLNDPEATIDSNVTQSDLPPKTTNENVSSSGVMRREVSVNERTSGTETQVGAILGTPAYMAPEQARGERDSLDCRADIFALGAILYRLLANTTPLGKGTVREIIARAKEGDFKPPREHDSSIPRALEAICLKAMRKRPEDRYQSSLDLKEDVEAWLADEPVGAYPDPLLLRLRRWFRRHCTAVLSAAAVLVTATVVPVAIKAVRHDRLENSVTQRFQSADSAIAQNDFQTAASLLDEAAGLLADEPELGDLASQVERKRSTVAAVLSRIELEQEQLRRAESEAARRVAEFNYERAERERQRANRNFIVASAQRLVAESKAVRQSHARLSMLLSVEAVELSRRRQETIVPEALQNLHDIAATFGGTGQFGHTDQIRDSAISPDGRWLLTGSKDRTARLWDLTSTDPWRESIELTGHEGAINCVALPTGNRWAITAGDDADVVLWDLTAADIRSEPIVLKGHDLPVTCLSVSADGRWLATSGVDADIRLWDLTNENAGHAARVLKGHADAVNQLCFSPSGDKLFSAGDDGIINAWPINSSENQDVSRTKEVVPDHQLKTHTSGVLSLAVSPSGNWLVSGDAQGSAFAWNLRSAMLTESFPLAGHRRAVTEAAFASRVVDSTDQPLTTERLATAGTDGNVIVWELADGEPRQLAEFQDHNGAVNDLVWNSAGTKLMSAGDDRTVRLHQWKPDGSHDADDSPSTLLGQEDAVWTLAANGDQLVSGALDGAVQVWDLSREEPGIIPLVLKHHQRAIQQVEASPDGKSLLALSSDRDQSWSLWQRKSDGRFDLVDVAVDSSEFGDVRFRATSVTWSPSSEMAAIAGSDNSVVLLTVSGIETQSIRVKLAPVNINALVFSADGSKLATTGNEGLIQVLDVDSLMNNRLLQLELTRASDSDFLTIASNPGRTQFASGSQDGGVIQWNSDRKWKLLPGSHRDAVNDLAFSPDGNLLASVSDDKSVRVWKRSVDGDFGDSPLVLVKHKDRVRAAAFTPDGQSLLTVSDDATAILWPLGSGNPEEAATILVGHESAIHACGVSDDGRWVATASNDGTVRLWDLHDENPSASSIVMHRFDEPVRAMKLIDQSKTLVAGLRNGELIVWPLDPEDLLNRVRRSAGRALSKHEIQQFKTTAGVLDEDTQQAE
ncbi:MAG: protein kinase [Rhodopirellula sp.]|nr:protein kinase [Rhodopirellula sp.]